MPGSLLLLAFFQRVLLWLERWDTYLFLKINTVWTSPFLDSVFPWWREANTWLPVYLFLLIFALINFKKKALPWVLFAVVTLLLTDQASSTFIKSWVARPRPCNDVFLMSHVRLLLTSCGGAYGFTSSHAANHFGFAMFIFITLQPILKKWGYLLFLWAASIAYAQVYVGVHYPLDILCGGIIGASIGYATAFFFNRKIRLFDLNTP